MAEKTFGRLTRGGVRPDLAGSHGIGRTRDWNPITVERQLAEQIGYFINRTLRDAAPGIKATFIAARLSAPHRTIGRGKFLQKNPLSAGLRRITGNLQRSVRATVTSPGTTASRFRGVFNLAMKVGGGNVQYAHRHENSGRMQFGSFTAGHYRVLIDVIRSGVAQIAAQFGGRVA